MVITCASHAQGPRFDPGQKHLASQIYKSVVYRENFYKTHSINVPSYQLLFVPQLAGELRAHAVSHLENVSGEGIEAMAKANTVAVLLPTTAYILRLEHPPARKMIKGGEAQSLTVLMVSWSLIQFSVVLHRSCSGPGE